MYRFVWFITKLIWSPWFYLIQFPSDPLSGQSCPLSFLHPDNINFDSSPPSSLPLSDCVFHSFTCLFGFSSCQHLSLSCRPLCSLNSCLVASSFVSQLYDVAINDILDLLSPAPLPLLTHNSSTFLDFWLPTICTACLLCPKVPLPKISISPI